MTHGIIKLKQQWNQEGRYLYKQVKKRYNLVLMEEDYKQNKYQNNL